MNNVNVQALLQRQNNPSFVLVEIGYGLDPIVQTIVTPFTGHRTYIGIENGMRGGVEGAQLRARRAAQRYHEQNVTFIIQDSHGQPRLPDACADEIFAGNVFCDPQVAGNDHLVRTLLMDMSRIARPDCAIVLRETVTPHLVNAQLLHYIQEAGLGIVARLQKQSSEWDTLESVYGRHDVVRGMKTHARSYYLFLCKL